jgi:hypothetical protein
MLEDLTNQPRVRPCRVNTIKGTLSAADQAKLEAAVTDPTWPVSQLEKQLRAKGLEISDSSITRHREKRCACSKI